MTILNMVGGGASGPKVPLDAISVFTVVGGDTEATITWTDPSDLTVNGVTVTTWSSTKLVRKIGSAPANINDGTLVVTETVRDTYSSTGYTDTGLTNDTTYYYAAFAIGDNGLNTISSTTPNVTPKGGWDMDNWTLAQTSSGLNGTYWGGVFFNTDGTKIFLSQYGNGGRVYESDLENPYDISSMTAVGTYLSIQHPEDIHFSTDGTKLFVLKSDVSPYSVLRYSLSTAWDISTATQDQTLSRTSPRDRGLYITPDGKSLYIGRVTHNSETPDVELYSLSTAWDLSTAGTSTVISTTLGGMGIWFGKGGKMYFKQDEGEGVLSYYNLSTPYDLSTATLGGTKNVGSNRAGGIWFNDTGNIGTIIGGGGNTNYVTKYTL